MKDEAKTDAPFEAEVVFDIHGRQGHGAADLYLPRECPLRAVVVYLHGGGWEGGQKDRPPAYRQLLEQRIALASIEYPLAPDATCPQMIDAIVAGSLAALDAVRSRTGGIPPWHLWGISAGGHLASLASMDPRLRGGTDVVPPMTVVSWCGPMDLESLYESWELRHENRPIIKRIVDGLCPGGTVDRREYSPITHVDGTALPHLLLHGRMDGLVPCSQSEAMHDALRVSGVPAEIYIEPGRDHGMPLEDSEFLRLTVGFMIGHQE